MVQVRFGSRLVEDTSGAGSRLGCRRRRRARAMSGRVSSLARSVFFAGQAQFPKEVVDGGQRSVEAGVRAQFRQGQVGFVVRQFLQPGLMGGDHLGLAAGAVLLGPDLPSLPEELL